MAGFKSKNKKEKEVIYSRIEKTFGASRKMARSASN
jgi:hypothetical protein